MTQFQSGLSYEGVGANMVERAACEPGDDPIVVVQRSRAVAPGEWRRVAASVELL